MCPGVSKGIEKYGIHSNKSADRWLPSKSANQHLLVEINTTFRSVYKWSNNRKWYENLEHCVDFTEVENPIEFDITAEFSISSDSQFRILFYWKKKNKENTKEEERNFTIDIFERNCNRNRSFGYRCWIMWIKFISLIHPPPRFNLTNIY